MKKLVFLLLFSCFLSYSYGQFYVQPSISYTMSINPTEKQAFLNVDSYRTVSRSFYRYGEGLHLGFQAGYNLGSNFFIELNGKKSLRAKHSFSTLKPNYDSIINNSKEGFDISGYFGDVDYEMSMLQISPLIGFRIQKNRYNVFLKAGPNFMKSSINQTLTSIQLTYDNGNFMPQDVKSKEEYSGNFHTGFQANIGLEYSLVRNLYLVFDFATVYNNYVIGTAKTTSFEVDGVVQTENLQAPYILMDFNRNFSHCAFNFGLKYEFKRKRKSEN